MIKEFNIVRNHGKQFIRDLEKVRLTELFRGRPEISTDITDEEARQVVDLCPVNAISRDQQLSINIGKCVFCNECVYACPGKIKFTSDYRMAVNRLDQLIIRAGDNNPMRPDGHAVRPEVRRLFKRSLKLRQVSAGGDNSGEMELNAAGNVNFDMGRFGIEFVASPRHADGVVVTGPITQAMTAALQLTWEAVPNPKILVLVGSDAISGGLFANSQAINRSFLDDHAADLYVPGNPAHPLTFIFGLLCLTGRLE